MSAEAPISSLLAERQAYRDSVAFGRGGPRGSRELERAVAVLAAHVRRRGGGHWLVVSGDAYELAVGLLATLHAGATAVLPANLQPGHLAALGAEVDGVLFSEPPVECAVPCLAISKIDAGEEALPLRPLDPYTAEIRLHTSGTTGAPLAVRKPLRCLEAEVAVLQSLFAHLPHRAVLATVPPYHIYGLLFRVLWPLASGRAMARDTIHFPGELASALKDVADAVLVSSPAFLKRALPVLDLEDLDARLRGIFSSGGPLPPEVAAAYNGALSHPVVEVYGSTETGGIGYRTVRAAEAPNPWVPLPGVRLAVAPDQDVLMVASPFLPRPGWHRTGDFVDLLPDRRFVLRGRADRIVKVEERRVSLIELEQRLGESADVAAVRVLRLAADEGRGASLGAVVVPTAAGWDRICAGGKQALKTSLLAVLRPHCDPAALPRRWRFVGRLPESAQGKTSEAELAGLFASERPNTSPVVLDRADPEDGLRLTLRLPPELRFFEGHFDVAPILAGVVQLDWAIRFAMERFAIAEPVRRIEALKFQSVIPAGAVVVLDLSYDRINHRLQFRYGSNDRDCSGGRIVFGAAP